MDIAIVGFGNIAERGHLPFYQANSGIDVKSVIDPVRTRRELAQKVIPGVRVFSSIKEMLAKVTVDMVDICSPPVFHVPAIREALSAGLHVLCEKPLAFRATEIASLMESAVSYGRVIYPCHTHKFAPAIQYIRDLMAQGYIGEPVTLSFRVLRRGHARGVAEWRPDWRHDRKVAGGGILVDHGTHLVYLACNILQRSPVRVSAFLGDGRHPTGLDMLTAEDTARVYLDFNGPRADLYLSWKAGSRAWFLMVEGTEGTVQFSHDTKLVVRRNNSVEYRTIPSTFDDPFHHGWFGTMFKDFQRTVNSNAIRHPTIIEAMITAEVLEKAYVSDENGGRWEHICGTH